MTEQKRRIAMVGTASSGAQAPFADPSYEIWGVAARAAYVTRADKWFELHRLDGEPADWAANWRVNLKSFMHDIPELVMFYPEPDLAKKVTTYPTDRIVQRFGTYHMTSSFAWMMALAIDEMCPLNGKWNPGEIAIYGVEMEYGTEYRQQRAGFRHFLALARFAGINVTLRVSGGLIYEPVPYPLWQDDPQINKISLRHKEVTAELDKLNASLRRTSAMIAQDHALIAECDKIASGPYDPKARKSAIESELDDLMATSASLSRDIVKLEGREEELRYWQDYLAP